MVSRCATVISRTRGVRAGGDHVGEQVGEPLVDTAQQAAIEGGADERGDDGLRYRLDIHSAVQGGSAKGLAEHDPAIARDDQCVQLIEAGGTLPRAAHEHRIELTGARFGGRGTQAT